jgi:hypothetical protein
MEIGHNTINHEHGDRRNGVDERVAELEKRRQNGSYELDQGTPVHVIQ